MNFDEFKSRRLHDKRAVEIDTWEPFIYLFEERQNQENLYLHD
jgi:hypothetical protein